MNSEDGPQWVSIVPAALCSIRTWVAVCLLWGAVIAWAHHREMDPDGFSYLQMADQASHGNVSALLNSYWSPGYPAILAVLFSVVHPRPDSAFAVAHLLNYILFIVALYAFVYFLRAWSKIASLPRELLVPCGFILFLKFSIDWMGLHNCTPDLCVGIVLLFSAGIVAKLSVGGSQRSLLFILGVALAIGYYVKAVMFPLDLLLIGLLLLRPLPIKRARLSLLFVTLVFALTSLPLVVAQSRLAGRVSFGETGRLNYAWYVNGIEGVEHIAQDSRVHLEHPPRQIYQAPVTLEFATPVNATYPLWYDPYYWAKGIRASFNLSQQIAALGVTFRTYSTMAAEIAVLISTGIVLLALGSNSTWLTIRQYVWMFAWPMLSFALYGLVHTETRFLGGFMIILWTGIVSIGLSSDRVRSRGTILAILGIALLLPTTLRFGLALGRIAGNIAHPAPTGEMVAAQALRSSGIQEGDRIAVVGATFEPYYAWLAGLRVVAQVSDQDALSRLSADEFQQWLSAVKSTGAKALVTFGRPSYPKEIHWRDLPVMRELSSTILESKEHQFSIYILDEK